MNDGELYPEIEPFERGLLDLDGRHRMYWEPVSYTHLTLPTKA